MSKLTIEEQVKQCEGFTPLDNRVIIVCDEVKQVQQKEYTLAAKPGTEKKGKNGVATAVLEKEYPMVPAKYQTATVVQVPADERILKVGDRVVYVQGTINDFDLFEGTSVVLRYNVVGIINNDAYEKQGEKEE